jgi:predicted nucleic acid-binding protein
MPGVEAASAVVVDASVAVKWVVDEPDSEMAAALLERPIRWIAPRLMLVEAAASLRRKVVQREIRATGAAASLRTLLDAVREGAIRLVEDEQLVDTALLLALELSHKVPDCVYLALAEREGCSLCTADRLLSRIARKREVGVLGVGGAGA